MSDTTEAGGLGLYGRFEQYIGQGMTRSEAFEKVSAEDKVRQDAGWVPGAPGAEGGEATPSGQRIADEAANRSRVVPQARTSSRLSALKGE